MVARTAGRLRLELFGAEDFRVQKTANQTNLNAANLNPQMEADLYQKRIDLSGRSVEERFRIRHDLIEPSSSGQV